MERFWSKVDASGDCWEWTASTDKDGYGWFNFNGQNQRAHRVAWQLLVGEIPAGLTIDHLCRNEGCVNPDHLDCVTLNENLKRAPGQITTTNASKTRCIHGHPLSGDNLHIRPSGWRACRACARRHVRDWSNRAKASDA